MIDLHLHTSASDGSYTPTEVVAIAVKANMSAIAITDHDTLDGLAEAQKAAQEAGIECIRGCEVSTRYDDEYNMHLLGLWIPENLEEEYPDFLEEMQTIQNIRNVRNENICKKLRDLGIPIEMSDLIKVATANNDNNDIKNSKKKVTIGRSHFAQYLIQSGVCKNKEEAFEEYIGHGKKAYVPRKPVYTTKMIETFSKVGVTTVLAHPALITSFNDGLKCPKEKLEHIIQKLAEAGLHGIEVYHSDHSQEDENFLIELAQKNNLLISGGSDFHGASKADINIGTGKGNLQIPDTILNKLKEARARV